MSRYIVMTAAAQMPASCNYHYRRVAVVEIDDSGIAPRFIGERARHLVRIVQTWERCNVGKNKRSAYTRALAEAELLCAELNAEVSK